MGAKSFVSNSPFWERRGPMKLNYKLCNDKIHY